MTEIEKAQSNGLLKNRWQERQIPEIAGSQQMKSVERLGALPYAQSGHSKMLLSQVEQAITICFVFMQHADQARQQTLP
jgi:hypothetical protein